MGEKRRVGAFGDRVEDVCGLEVGSDPNDGRFMEVNEA